MKKKEKIKNTKKIKTKKIKETLRKGSEWFEIMKINVIKELEEIELKLRKLDIIESVKESLGEIEMKMLKK